MHSCVEITNNQRNMMAISSYRTEQYRQLAATVDFWLTSLVIHGDLPAAVLDKLVQNIATGQFLIEPKRSEERRVGKECW